MKKKKKITELPDLAQLENELKREENKSKFKSVFASTVFGLVVVAAVAVLVAVLWMPVLRIYGTSMTPTLTEGNIVVAAKTSDIERGDIVGVYYGRKLLIKRCIATAGEWVDINNDGVVFINGIKLDEPYITEPSLGETNIELPYQVPEDCIFVMGDHRVDSIDSRNGSVGCINSESIIGKIIFRVWPLSSFGTPG